MTGMRRRSNRGFTLVELLVVGALIALFAGLAIFGVQQQFRSNKRKATIGEARQLATALDFANLDTSVFPKLCWLDQSDTGMDLVSYQLTGSTNSTVAFDLLDYNGRGVLQNVAARRQWKGPYFAMSQSRAGVAQGRGGIVNVVLGESDLGAVNNEKVRWPADPYGTPWVLYMLDLDASVPNSPRLHFVNDRAQGDPTVKGNYVNAVVSYGEDLVPGTYDPNNPGIVPPSGPGNTADPDATGPFPWNVRLFTGSFKNGALLKMPNYQDYLTTGGGSNAALARDRAAVWGQEFYKNTSIPSTYVGISDTGSDDVVFEF